MQKKSGYMIPVGIKWLSNAMEMEESEVRYFPKLSELKECIYNYNYCKSSKQEFLENLSSLKEMCKEPELLAYVSAIDNLVSVVKHY